MQYEFADERYPLSSIKYTVAILHYTQIVKHGGFSTTLFSDHCVLRLIYCSVRDITKLQLVGRESSSTFFYQFRQLLTPIYSTVKASVML